MGVDCGKTLITRETSVVWTVLKPRHDTGDKPDKRRELPGEISPRLADLPEKPASFFEASFSLEISHREIESEAEKPQFDSDYDGVTVKLSSILRRVSPSDDVISKLLVQGSIASKGALAFGGLRVGYGQIFLQDSVVDTGRTGTAWEEPGCFQIKKCFRF